MDTTTPTRRDRRVALGLTVEDLARILEVDQSTLYRWEQGQMGIHPLRDAAWGRTLRRLERRAPGPDGGHEHEDSD